VGGWVGGKKGEGGGGRGTLFMVQMAIFEVLARGICVWVVCGLCATMVVALSNTSVSL